MAMNDAPAISLAPEDPCRADFKRRLLCMSRDFEAHFLALHDVAKIPVYVRGNSLNRKGPVAVLRIRPVKSWPDLFPTPLATPTGDAKEGDLGRTRPESLQGLRTASK